jgi:hypothetical protein
MNPDGQLKRVAMLQRNAARYGVDLFILVR